VRLGIGDDAAVWRPTARRSSVITTDTLVEGVHFRLDWTDWRSLGHKLLAVNLSDIAAMGASPLLATITLALTGDERVSDLEELYIGAATLAEPHGVAIVGGDIVRTPGPIMLSVTAIGEADNVLRRRGAQPGDRIIVSGTLGASAAGMRLLESPRLRSRAATAELLVAAHLRPNPRLALGNILLNHGATAAMDLSDGLLGDLPKILVASEVAARVSSSHVPVLPAVRALFPDNWLELALRGGEDYELLATVPPGALDGIERAAAAVGATITDIGEILARQDGEPLLSLVDDNDDVREIQAGAFDHFG
jgi:thiamine-monophosphate kinase